MSKNLSGYVFGKDVYLLAKWFIPVVVCPLGVLFIYAVVISENTIVGAVVIAPFIALFVYLIASRPKMLKRLSLQYTCKSNTAANFSNGINVNVNMNHSIFICRQKVPANRYSAEQQFYMISSSSIPRVSDWEDNPLNVVYKAAEKKVVIVPINEATSVWLSENLPQIEIPNYPKVAYISKD